MAKQTSVLMGSHYVKEARLIAVDLEVDLDPARLETELRDRLYHTAGSEAIEVSKDNAHTDRYIIAMPLTDYDVQPENIVDALTTIEEEIEQAEHFLHVLSLRTRPAP